MAENIGLITSLKHLEYVIVHSSPTSVYPHVGSVVFGLLTLFLITSPVCPIYFSSQPLQTNSILPLIVIAIRYPRHANVLLVNIVLRLYQDLKIFIIENLKMCLNKSLRHGTPCKWRRFVTTRGTTSWSWRDRQTKKSTL